MKGKVTRRNYANYREDLRGNRIYDDGNIGNIESNNYDRNISSNSFVETQEGSSKEELHIPTLFNQTIYFMIFFLMKLGYEVCSLFLALSNFSRLTIALFFTMSSFDDDSMLLIDVHGRLY